MKIAVIGTGFIGGTFGRAMAAAGHEVTCGSRKRLSECILRCPRHRSPMSRDIAAGAPGRTRTCAPGSGGRCSIR